MAEKTLPAGIERANSNMTRRNVFASMFAAATASAVLPAAAGATVNAEAPAASPLFQQLLAIARRADAVADRYDRVVYGSRKAAYDRAVETIPHYTFPQSVPGYGGSKDDWTTADTYLVRYAKGAIKQKPRFFGPGSEQARAYYLDQRRLVAADKWRERARIRINRSLGLGQAVDRSNELNDFAAQCFDNLFEQPATNAADVHLKLQTIVERGRDAEWTNDLILADLARLIGGEA